MAVCGQTGHWMKGQKGDPWGHGAGVTDLLRAGIGEMSPVSVVATPPVSRRGREGRGGSQSAWHSGRGGQDEAQDR